MTDTEQTETTTETAEAAAGNGDDRRNIRSTIAFPYSGLGDAEQVAEALHERGDSASLDQVAAQLNQTVTSGAFRTKIATARIFGAIEVRRGEVRLTALGRRLVDPEKVREARVEAFKHVPLFKQIYEEYKGHQLPSAAGIEAQMEKLGVSPKQTDRARQALQKSAERAGFFESGKDRLVEPALSGANVQDQNMDKPPRQNLSSELPEWAAKMFLTLLNEGESWSAEQTHAYIQGARTAYKAQG